MNRGGVMFDRNALIGRPSMHLHLRRLKSGMFSTIGSINGANEPTNHVALTFDDGPDPSVTPQILDLLSRYRAKATFFVLTEKASQRPNLVRRMIVEGHEVGLHFDRHDRLTSLPAQIARQRLTAAKTELEGLVGPVRYFRPPHGSQSLRTFFLAKSLGMEVVTWGPAAEDWIEQAPSEGADRALRKIAGGEILLLHDAVEVGPNEIAPAFDRVKMVELILEGIRARNLAPTSVGTMIATSKPRLSPWFMG